MIRRIAVGALCTIMVQVAAAQQAPDAVDAKVLASLDRSFVEPGCKLEGGGDFRVRSGRTYLNTAITASTDQANKDRAVRDGIRVISDAITGAGQAKNPAAWYYLGRLYLQQANLAGADSSFARAEALAPACKADIEKYRYRVWASLVNAGTGYRKAEQNDSALVMFRAADVIYRDLPLGYVSMADLFSATDQKDSALVYFGKAAATHPTDTIQVKIRNQALFNLGVMQFNFGRHADAVASFEEYLRVAPEDATAKKALAQAYRATGQDAKAQALEHELLATAGPQTGGEGLSERDLMDIAGKQFEDKNYAEAAATYLKVTELNPWQRDAWFNLANCYLALKDGGKLAEAGTRLLGIEPMSEYAHNLTAQGYRMAGNTDGVFKTIVAREALLANVEVDALSISAKGATLSGKATGREARDENNKLIPARPQTLVVEFLGKGGNVVTTADVAVPALKPGEVAPLSAEGSGAGITAWRYKAK